MSKRVAAGQRVGFFKKLLEADGVAEDDGAVEGRLEVGEELGEGVYRVERVVERRKRKVSCSCTANYFSTMYNYTSTFLGENGVIGAMGRVQAGGGDMDQGRRGDCCSIEVSCQAILM